MGEERRGVLYRLRAGICHHCPLCKHGRATPDSVIGRVLHHKLHADHCPMWKAEKEVYGGEDQRQI